MGDADTPLRDDVDRMVRALKIVSTRHRNTQGRVYASRNTAIEIVAALATLDTTRAAPLDEARTAMYGLISERVISNAPGDWMRFEADVNAAFDALSAPATTETTPDEDLPGYREPG